MSTPDHYDPTAAEHDPPLANGWFAMRIQCDRHLTAGDVSDALYAQFEARPGFTASVVKVRERTHDRLNEARVLREALERIVREDHAGGAGWMAEIAQAALDAADEP